MTYAMSSWRTLGMFVLILALLFAWMIGTAPTARAGWCGDYDHSHPHDGHSDFYHLHYTWNDTYHNHRWHNHTHGNYFTVQCYPCPCPEGSEVLLDERIS